VVVADLENAPLNVKQLLSAVPYSPMAVRNHLDNLIANEWIFLEGDQLDARRKFVRSRAKLIEALEEVLGQLYLQSGDGDLE
jgi:DNA-binding MarR family transcriptional regulator